MPFEKGNQFAKLKGKNKKTIDKEIALECLRQRILTELEPVLRGAIDSARGLTVMYQRKKVKDKKTKEWHRTGELVQVKDQTRVQELLTGNQQGDDWYYITTKDPNIQAVKELWDRAFGKVKEQVELTGKDDGPIEVNNRTLSIAKKFEEELNKQEDEKDNI